MIVISAALFGAPLLVAFLLTAVVGAAKEVYDYFHPEAHTAEWMDLFATVAGGAVAVAILRVLM